MRYANLFGERLDLDLAHRLRREIFAAFVAELARAQHFEDVGRRGRERGLLGFDDVGGRAGGERQGEQPEDEVPTPPAGTALEHSHGWQVWIPLTRAPG